MKKKKLIAVALSAAMMLTMATPTFAAEIPSAEDVTTLVTETVKVTKPSKVQDVKVLKNGYKSLKVTWKKVEGATKYEVYRSTTGKSGSFALKKTTTSTSYTNTGITCGKTYYYKVRAVNSKGKGSFSATKSGKVQPATPSVKITLGGSDSKPYDHTPKVSWKAVSGASGYEVYRTIKGKNKWKRVVTTTKISYLDSSKAGFRSYYRYEYKVRSYRTVSEKKVYSYFTSPKEYVPNWTMDDLMPELIAYGESIKGKRLQYNLDTEEFEPYTGPEGKYYTLYHKIGYIEDANSETGYRVVKWGDKEAMKDPTFEMCTPENSSCTEAFPEVIGYYYTKETVLKEAKSLIKFAIEKEMYGNPASWMPADDMFPAGWIGTETFTIYTRKVYNPSGLANGYMFWVMH